MPRATVKVESEYFFEEGWVEAVLKEVKERTVKYTVKPGSSLVTSGKAKVGDEGSFTRWDWTFEITSGDYKGSTIKVESNDTVTTRDNDIARQMIEAMIDAPLSADADVDTDDYVGMVLQGRIFQQPPVRKRDGSLGYYCTFNEFAPAGDQAGEAPDAGISHFTDEPPF